MARVAFNRGKIILIIIFLLAGLLAIIGPDSTGFSIAGKDILPPAEDSQYNYTDNTTFENETNFIENNDSEQVLDDSFQGVQDDFLDEQITDEVVETVEPMLTKEFLSQSPSYITATCGQTITSSVTIDNDLTCTTSQILIIGADNIVIDCTNHKLTGNTANVGIDLSSRTNVTIKNCIINNTNYGIYLWSSSNNNLTNNTAYNNSNGIRLESNSNYNNLTNNTAYNNSNAGIRIEYSNTTTIINNSFYNNKYDGIFLVYANNNTLNNNTAYNNSEGIYLFESSNNTLTNNTAYNSTYGILIQQSSNNNTLTNNTAYNNSDSGIRIESSSNNNTLTNNTAYKNSYGIYLYNNANNNTLTNNTAYNNTEGLYLSGSRYNLITGNNASENGNAILLFHSDYNVVTKNTANHNRYSGIGGMGFAVMASSYNVFDNNTASNLNDEGFNVQPYSYYNNITNNILDGNSLFNIYVYDSDNNNFINNTIKNGRGLRIDLSYNNSITGNNITGLEFAIRLSQNSSYNNITSNYILGSNSGVYIIESSSNNLIFNNFFNSSLNAYANTSNFWNTTKTAGTNIIGGPYIGGNYWSNYAGSDTDSDGLGNTLLPYNNGGQISTGGDYLPLVLSSIPTNCGNGVVDSGEQCDPGANNPNDCCSATCQNESSSYVCKVSSDLCDVAEQCTGSSASCPADVYATAGTLCNSNYLCSGWAGGNNKYNVADFTLPSQGYCDGLGKLASNCNRATTSGTRCSLAEGTLQEGTGLTICVDGNSACVNTCLDGISNDGDSCIDSVDSNCGGTETNCADSIDNDCDGLTDSSDTLDCISTCGNGVVNSGEQCDLGSNNGQSGYCCSSSCTFLSSSTVCRSVAGVCDVAENCTGSSAACPTDGYQPSSMICRPSTGQCDLDDYCSGSSVSCPTDVFKASGTPCDDGLFCFVNEQCNGAGSCVTGSARDCSDAVACTDDTCNDGSDSCVHTADNSKCSAGTCDDSTGYIFTGICNALSGCERTTAPTETTEAECSDHIDNDCNGLTDCSETICDLFEYCQIYCGNGRVDLGEDCDGRNLSGKTCSSLGFQSGFLKCFNNCKFNRYFCYTCGNGDREAFEECDDGNTVSGDGCSATCTIEIPQPANCGNGITQPEFGEECDPGVNDLTDCCTSDCKFEINGTICDDHLNCTFSICNTTGVCEINETEQCTICNTGPCCGDLNLEICEECDDGNNLNGDGCNETCYIETKSSSGSSGGGGGGGGSKTAVIQQNTTQSTPVLLAANNSESRSRKPNYNSNSSSSEQSSNDTRTVKYSGSVIKETTYSYGSYSKYLPAVDWLYVLAILIIATVFAAIGLDYFKNKSRKTISKRVRKHTKN